ncbi:MAG TPA: FctA domain-containing protein [Bacillota bacterium]|nr:FctA domain-containing protein [Bacillota bacterium]
MKKKQTKFMMFLLILTMCLVLPLPKAFAAEIQSGEIPVTVSLGGEPLAADEDYEITMKADNADYPMPAGSVDGLFTMKVTGADTGKLPGIEFSSLGIYTYSIFQEAGTNELVVYDDSVYNLTVYVTNAEDGSGLETTLLLYLLGETAKHDEVAFNNLEEAFLGVEDIPEDKTPEKEKPKDKELEKAFLGVEDIKLPKTGEIAPMAFYGIGGLLLALGIGLGPKKRK